MENRVFGHGKIIRGKKGKLKYSGTFPSKPFNGEEVYLMRGSDLEIIAQSQYTMFLSKRIEMEEKFYDQREEGSIFPDELHIEGKEGTVKLFLDRHWYSINKKSHLWIRYCTMDESLKQENF